MMQNYRMSPGENSADFCRRMGWAAGDRLAGDEGYGTTIIEITAIGEMLLIARMISHDGNPRDYSESLWTLCCRNWERVLT